MMNEEILKRLKEINNEEAIDLFFSELRVFLTDLKLLNTNEKLALNIRNDYRKRISVVLNSRLVYGITNVNENLEFYFMIYEEDLKQIKNLNKTEQDDSFALPTNNKKCLLVLISYDNLIEQRDLINTLWLKCCKDYLPQNEKSRYRKHHIPELFELAYNDELLQSYLTAITTDKNGLVEYFNDKDFETLARYAKIRKEDNQYHNQVNEYLKSTYNKVGYWAEHINDKLFKDNGGHTQIRKRPTNRGGVFEEYQWAKIYPQKGAPAELAFTVGIDKNDQLTIKIDTVGLLDNDEKRKVYFNYRGDWNNSKIVKNIPKSEVLSLGWDKLIQITGDYIKSILPLYIELTELLGLEFKPTGIMLNKKIDNMDSALNQILFGPPGTGKTYHTVTEAIKIVDNDFYKANAENRSKLQERFNELLIKDWKEPKGQISFCTLHQSFSYEDFVEGIKPVTPKEGDQYLKYKVEWGIFKNICRLADADNNAQKLVKDNLVSFSSDEFNKAVFYKVSLGDSNKEEDKEIYDYCINNNLISIGFGESIDFSGMDESKVTQTVSDQKLDPYVAQVINYFKNYVKVGNYVVISYGNNFIRALGKVTGEYSYNPDSEIQYKHFRSVEWIFKNVEIPVREFYQKNLMQQTIYKLKNDLIIPEFFVRKRTIANDVPQKKYVLVIDEINRGNVSSIFGELITLIEPTKRTGKPEALSVVLPYSKEIFTVPSNVYIIGTMNTADRSIESLDTALRRRFSFKEMTSNPELIKREGISKGKIGDIDLVELLQKINERIEKLIDKDHMIGHSYFLEINTPAELQAAFKDKVIPLLEEYFFGDFGKIGLVLGSSFISKVEMTDFKFANFSDYDSQTEQDLKQRSVYKIKPESEWDYKSIY